MRWFLLWVLFSFPMMAAETVGYLLRSAYPESVHRLFERPNDTPLSDPFAVETMEDKEWVEWVKRTNLWKKNSPADLSKCVSSMLKKGDVTYDLTEIFQIKGYLAEKDSWAVLNQTSKRLVIHGTKMEQAAFDTFTLSDLPLVSWRLEVELFEVPDRQAELEQWNSELLKTRQARSLGKVFASGRPGQKVKVKTGHWELEAEANTGFAPPVTIAGNYTLRLKEGKERIGFTRERTFSNYANVDLFEEIGSAPGMEITLVLRVRPQILFSDGTSYDHRRIDEKGKAIPDEMNRRSFWTMEKDGMTFTREWRNADFFADVEGHSSFLNQREVKNSLAPFPKSFFRKPLDVAKPFEDMGMKLKKGEWIYYDPETEFLWSGLRGNNAELFEAITGSGCVMPPKNILVALSLVSHENAVSARDLRTKKFAAKTLIAEAHVFTRPGARNVVELLRADEKTRFRVEMEPNIGASDSIIECRWLMRAVGESGEETEMVTGMTFQDGERFLLPISKKSGKQLSLVVEARILDGRGRFWADDE